MSSHISSIARNNIIRKACRRAGWAPDRTYSDKRKLDKRLSFVKRLSKVSKPVQERVADEVATQLNQMGVDFHIVYWTRSRCEYPHEDIQYDKLCVLLPL